MKCFKHGQTIIATLPNGKKTDGTYIEKIGNDLHTISTNIFVDIDKNGNPIYKSKIFHIPDKNISVIDDFSNGNSIAHYKMWLKRSMSLEININNNKEKLKYNRKYKNKKNLLKEKILRDEKLLSELDKKIKAYESKM